MTSKEVLKTFFSRNLSVTAVEMSESFSKTYQEYEKDRVPQYAGKMKDGNCFMEHITPSICVVKTIITDDMLYESQEDVFGQLENLRQKFGRIDKDFNLSANPVDNRQPNHFNRPLRYLGGRFCLFFPHISPTSIFFLRWPSERFWISTFSQNGRGLALTGVKR